VVLDAVFPRAFDVGHLTWCRSLVVHTADIGGPEACIQIFRSVRGASGASPLVEAGVSLMRAFT